ncbi:hypothetical protein [Thermosinus carboxydivorans]|uniref:hypothetical protein n=1 Tax=Thermosinus carboxydivorans TaxID=261685 RepID=UPI0003042733|nr:hypothetical protein [Thermosinus carboxydivorans]
MSRIWVKWKLRLGKYITVDEVVEKIDQVTADDLRNIINRLFGSGALSLTTLGPVKETVLPELKI